MATYFVDKTTGNDADDGLSEANAWATIDKAMNTVAAGDKVWVKSGADYTETATIDTTGTQTAPITFEGYTSTIGDGGRAVINGGAARASGILDSIAAGGRVYYVFKNFQITNHTSHGVNTDQLHIFFKNCKFDTNGGAGFNGRHAMFEGCEFSDNTGDGAVITTTGAGVFAGCKFYRNAGDGIDCQVSLVCAFCEFFSNGDIAIRGGAANDAGGLMAIINCTIDGDTDDTTVGIDANISFHHEMCVLNTIVYDCATGISANHGTGEQHISRANLVNANTANYSGFNTVTGEVTAAPQFNNEGAQDYSLASASPARNSGFDVAAAGMDMGASQSTDAAGTSGGLNAIRTGGYL